MKLKDWIAEATLKDLVERLAEEPGFLDVRDTDGDGFGPLHHAAAHGRVDLVRAITGRGASVDQPSGAPTDPLEYGYPFKPGYTPLQSASRQCRLDVVKYLLSVGAGPDKADYAGGTALHSAVAGGSVSVMNVLLAAGSNPNADCEMRYAAEELGYYWVGSPLHIAARGDDPAAARLLIGHGADVDFLLLDERRPLHYAVASGALAASDVLLRAGADPSRPEKFHIYTPLHYAAQEGHVEIVALLLRHGADPGARLKEGDYRPVDLARTFHDAERAEAMVNLLKGRQPSR